MEDLISVIVPIYNVKPYLKQCLESILHQTYPLLEILLIDDGSTDGSGEIADEYALKDKRIKVVHQQNAGLSAARNSGIREATGTYYLFVDSDDYIKEDMVEHLYGIICRNDAQIAVCGYYMVDEEERILADTEEFPEEDLVTEKRYWTIYQNSAYLYCLVVWNKLYHKDIFRRLRFPEGKLCEDVFILHKFLEQDPKITCSSSKKYYYRKRYGSITNQNHCIHRIDSAEALLGRLYYFGRKRMYSEALFAFREAVDSFLIAYEHSADYDRHNKDRLKKLESALKKAAVIFMKKPISMIFRIRILIFITDKRLYILLRKIRKSIEA